jgi:pilus assembly protein Flp/PilA
MRKELRKLIRDESGVTAIEYALIAALISVVLVTAMGTLGGDIKTAFANIGASLTAAQ